MQFEKSIVADLDSFIEVNLEATFNIPGEAQRSVPVEILVLSPMGAILQAEVTPSVGELLSVSLKTDPPSIFGGTVKNYLNWNDSKKVFLMKFENLNQAQERVLQQLVDYFTRLKRAGVRLGT